MLSKILFRCGVVTLAFVILFLSVARAGLELIAQEGGVDGLKKNEVIVQRIDIDGEVETSIYKLPEVGMLPDNIMYGFKRIRDYFWLTFSNGPNKIKISTLMADKKIVEFSELTLKDKLETAIEAGNEAVDKLEYADSLISNLAQTDPVAKQLHQQIYLAGFAYRQIVKQSELKYGFEPEKHTKLINRIDERNKNQEKDRYSWDF